MIGIRVLSLPVAVPLLFFWGCFGTCAVLTVLVPDCSWKITQKYVLYVTLIVPSVIVYRENISYLWSFHDPYSYLWNTGRSFRKRWSRGAASRNASCRTLQIRGNKLAVQEFFVQHSEDFIRVRRVIVIWLLDYVNLTVFIWCPVCNRALFDSPAPFRTSVRANISDKPVRQAGRLRGVLFSDKTVRQE